MEIILNSNNITFKNACNISTLMVYITRNNLDHYVKNDDVIVTSTNKIQLYNLLYEMSIYYSLSIY